MGVYPDIRVQAEDFDLTSEVSKLTKGQTNIGAVVSFCGLCRDEAGRLSSLELEHYPGMAEEQIRRFAAEAIERFELNALTAIHRFGKMSPGENIVLVIAASPHRQAAFDGANYLMDFLKTSAPFWKKEHQVDGSPSIWVDAKDDDDSALKKWDR